MLKRRMRHTHTHLSPRNFPVPAFRDGKKVGKDPQRHIPNPCPFYKVAMRMEVVVDCDLDEIARHMSAACKEDLRSRISRWETRWRRLEGASTHVDDTFGHESSASESKV